MTQQRHEDGRDKALTAPVGNIGRSFRLQFISAEVGLTVVCLLFIRIRLDSSGQLFVIVQS